MSEIEIPRARAYMLLATVLAAPPPAELLRGVAALEGDGTEWGWALDDLAARAARIRPSDAEREFNRLFIGLTRGELVPYASFYLTGFLQDRPLVRLRQDMARVGIVREAGVSEPEDHIAAMLEIMAGLIDGRFGEALPRVRQQEFLERHLASWAPRFFADLEEAKAADFYRPVGRLGRLLLEIEENAFALAD